MQLIAIDHSFWSLCPLDKTRLNLQNAGCKLTSTIVSLVDGFFGRPCGFTLLYVRCVSQPFLTNLVSTCLHSFWDLLKSCDHSLKSPWSLPAPCLHVILPGDRDQMLPGHDLTTKCLSFVTRLLERFHTETEWHNLSQLWFFTTFTTWIVFYSHWFTQIGKNRWITLQVRPSWRLCCWCSGDFLLNVLRFMLAPWLGGNTFWALLSTWSRCWCLSWNGWELPLALTISL